MSPREAQRVIEALANGIHPETGEVLPEESPYNHPHVIRSLFLASRAIDPLVKREEVENERPGRAGKPWSSAEDTRLLSAFDGGTSIEDLAAKHERTKEGIASRLVRLGRISERSEAYDRN